MVTQSKIKIYIFFLSNELFSYKHFFSSGISVHIWKSYPSKTGPYLFKKRKMLHLNAFEATTFLSFVHTATL